VAEGVRWLFTATMHALNWGELPQVEAVGVFMYGRAPGTLAESLAAKLGMTGLSALLGVGLALLVPPRTGANYRVKAAFYSLVVWLVADAAAWLLHAQYLRRMGPDAEASNMMAALVWGLTGSGLLTWLNGGPFTRRKNCTLTGRRRLVTMVEHSPGHMASSRPQVAPYVRMRPWSCGLWCHVIANPTPT
jgi:hypothetical protein